ncbi:zinc finger and BTB domain-containing protein 22b [Syngnathus typhle]|uniref:zinc finger and BTB domain-containing protein 22b n=1 Tax=Syngnathus typhle TaxID=161592 RepID=UPI002A6AA331|nr:zinc finger and BTB domain-containing protein 22b [Syngnathus typhle]XP_061123889.1 zinc finger and BTB domain-containing protein 22b [Syngnathus typhle]
MQSASAEVGSSADSVVQVCFPSSQALVLDGLNQQREEGRLCDLSIHVQGHVFKAHRCVLAASSSYFHDQVLLKNMSSVSIPAVMDPLAFESVLRCAYTGQLTMLREDIVNYLTVGSVLQMWHIVDKCTELLKEGRTVGGGSSGGSTNGGVLGRDSVRPAGSQDSHCSYANVERSLQEPSRTSQLPSRLSASESQSPSSTNYFSPGAATNLAGGGGVASNTPSYCTPSGEEALMIEGRDEDDEGEEEEVYQQKLRGGGRMKKLEEEVGVSDSFGVSSYQDGEDVSLQRRPAYIQPSIMPRKQWVVVKAERPEDDDLIVVSGEEGGGADDEEDEEEEDDERGMASGRGRDCGDFAISHVRTLSVEAAEGVEADAQMDYSQSSDDFLKLDGSLLDAALAQQVQDSAVGPNPSQGANRAASGLLGQVPTRTQLFPVDMQGNQILVFGQTSALSMDAGPPPMSGMIGAAAAFKSVAHGPAVSGSDGGGGGGGSAKVFMCHCGKTFTHKSMRDRHINMHLDLRPFHCPVCAKKFKMKHHLTEHMKTHTGLKPYHCTGCGKKFMWRDSFMRHRSHCQRRGGGSGGDIVDVLPGPHLLLPPGEGGLRGGGASSTSRLHHVANGASSGSSMAATIFGSLPLEHNECTDLSNDS